MNSKTTVCLGKVQETPMINALPMNLEEIDMVTPNT